MLEQNLHLRLLAVAMLLGLRPCAILLCARFVSTQAGREARVEYIDDERAIEYLAFCREAFARALQPVSKPGCGALPRGIVLSLINVEQTLELRFIIPSSARLHLSEPHNPILSCRAPPAPLA